MGKYTEQTCCFTGHRDIPAGEEIKIKTRVYHRIQPLISKVLSTTEWAVLWALTV